MFITFSAKLIFGEFWADEIKELIKEGDGKEIIISGRTSSYHFRFNNFLLNNLSKCEHLYNGRVEMIPTPYIFKEVCHVVSLLEKVPDVQYRGFHWDWESIKLVRNYFFPNYRLVLGLEENDLIRDAKKKKKSCDCLTYDYNSSVREAENILLQIHACETSLKNLREKKAKLDADLPNKKLALENAGVLHQQARLALATFRDSERHKQNLKTWSWFEKDKLARTFPPF